METQQRIRIGDKVQFYGKGRKLVGVVARVRLKQRKGKARRLAELVTGDATSLDQMVAEIAVEQPKKCMWTVGVNLLKVVGKGDVNAAQDVVGAIKQNHRDNRMRTQSRNFGHQKDSGLLDLKNGDPIEVQYRGGYWVKAIYRGIVPGSLNVRFEEFGRTRTCSPKFVRKAQVQQ